MKTGICLLAALSAIAMTALTAAPEPTPETKAVELARGMMQAMGGETAWKQAHYVRFDFIMKSHGKSLITRAHLWDKQTGRYRLEDATGRPVRCGAVPIFATSRVRRT